MKGRCTRGFGIIEDPKTGEEINVEDTFEVPEPVFDRLKEHYPGIEAVSSGEDTENDNTPTEKQSSATQTFRCGVNDCQRMVKTPDDVCWQHEDG